MNRPPPQLATIHVGGDARPQRYKPPAPAPKAVQQKLIVEAQAKRARKAARIAKGMARG